MIERMSILIGVSDLRAACASFDHLVPILNALVAILVGDHLFIAHRELLELKALFQEQVETA